MPSFFFFSSQICFNRRILHHLSSSMSAAFCIAVAFEKFCVPASTRATFFYVVTSLLYFMGLFPAHCKTVACSRHLQWSSCKCGAILPHRWFIWKAAVVAASVVTSLDLLWQTLAVMSGIKVSLNRDCCDKFI